MTGLIEQVAAEHRAAVAKERGEALHRQIESDGRREVERRERTIEARRLAMRAAKSMTGRVIFPARWTIVPVDQDFRRCLRETVEGRVTIWVYTNMGYVERIIVGSDEAGKTVEWKNPRRQDVPPARWPAGPGPGWFRQALVELEVI